MNKEQKDIIKKIKTLVKQLDATIQEDRDEQVSRSAESEWVNGRPKERPKRG
tara:strand:+ start:9908 stop:10063 length:156 start_codon:yes stop_codon:yes gene_type:complete